MAHGSSNVNFNCSLYLQLEKVILMLENAKRDTDGIQNRKDVSLNMKLDQRQDVQVNNF